MKAYLEGIDKEYEIPEGESIVGRHNQNSIADIQIQEFGMENISRFHCRIYNDGNNLDIKDEDSKNGTFINEKRIEKKSSLEHQDTLTLGNVELKIKIKQRLFR